MSRELASYLRLHAVIAAAFNLFIGGLIASLLYHKADVVPTDPVSIAIDLLITCLLTFAISTPFCRASLRRDGTGGVLSMNSPPARLLAWLFYRPAIMSVSLGICVALALFALLASLFTLLGVTDMPFYPYIAFKSALCAALGAFATVTMLYAGMCGTAQM